MYDYLEKDFEATGENKDCGWEFRQNGIRTELYYSSGKGYFMSAYACSHNTNKEKGYTSESTMLLQNGSIRYCIDDGRKSKAREEKARQYYKDNKERFISLVKSQNPCYPN